MLGLLGFLFVSSAFGAPDSNPVEVHGFGFWAYGLTDNNHYLLGDASGVYDHAALALNIAANPHERLSVVGQIEFENGGGQRAAELDFAFAQWAFSDAAKLRLGNIKQPFGIYNEVFEVGTLRPFLTLPQGLYGPAGFVAEAYNGVGVGGQAFAGRWGLTYDVYGGGVALALSTPIDMLDPTATTHAVAALQAPNTLGARVEVNVPGDAVDFGVSTYAHPAEEQPPDQLLVFWVGAAHANVHAGRTQFTAEYAHHGAGPVTFDGAYGELAYRFTAHWQLAARGDWHATADSDGSFSTAPSLGRHLEVAGGINYWFTPGFVVKASVHDVRGNRFAHPLGAAQLRNQVASGRLDTHTQLFALGTNFSF